MWCATCQGAWFIGGFAAGATGETPVIPVGGVDGSILNYKGKKGLTLPYMTTDFVVAR